MPMTPRQLPLSLPHRAAMTRADFLAGESNRAAIAAVDAWPHWPTPVTLIVGPPGSGKSHLVEIWRTASGAVVAAADRPGDVEALASAGAVAVEDLHDRPDERALFHLINRAGERGAALLLTSRKWPSALPLALPDLKSRLRAARPVELAAPDDVLLRQVLLKLFADRQLAVDPQVVEVIAQRMERSLAAAGAIVEALDREALAEGAPITRRMAVSVLSRIFDGQPDLFGD
jgi:chromosomal replication initiation ATPase DnaA